MMKFRKYMAFLIVAVLFATAFASCSKPKVIPEDVLSDIFRDMYVVNSYAGRHEINFDSIDIYEPILRSHGYTVRDFNNTMGNFAKQKSARISHVIDAAILKLENEQEALQEKVKNLDYIDSVAFARSRDTIYMDSLISIRKQADTSKLKINIPIWQRGVYKLSYYYKLDSLDENKNVQSRHVIKDTLGMNIFNTSNRMRVGPRTRYSIDLRNDTDKADRIELTFGNYPKDPKRMNLTIDSLYVVFEPAREEALQRLIDSFMNYRFVIEDKEYNEYYAPAPDKRPLRLRPPHIFEERDSLVLE